MLKNLWFSRAKASDANLAHLLQEIERLAAAGDLAGALRKCQDVPPPLKCHPEILVMEGGLLGRLERYDEAAEPLNRALKTDGCHRQGLLYSGNIALVQGRYAEAAERFGQAAAVGPIDAALLANYGKALKGAGRLEEAKNLLGKALKLSPGFMPAIEPLCQILVEQQSFEQALGLLEMLIEANPDSARLVRLKGFILYKRFYMPDEADRLFDLAEKLGEQEAQFWKERGECAHDMGDDPRALHYYDKALAISPQDPVVTFNKAVLGLMHEEYATAWAGYEARFEGSTLGKLQLPAPRWDGGRLAGANLIVIGEQGIGDEIMFASCLEDLPRDGHVTLSCTGKLQEIFQASFPQIRCVARNEPLQLEQDKPGYAIAAGSLPALYRKSRDDFPRRPYLVAPEHARDTVAPFLAGLPAGLKVGLSWRGGTEASRSRLRSIPLASFADLLKIPSVTWVSLQYGDCTSDLELLQGASGAQLHHDSAILADYARTAALVEGLDLVVTVCTAIVHLAGALGKEVWVLAPKVPEWRYGLGFRFMPWYRQVEVLRQPESGDWSTLLDTVRRRLLDKTQ